MGWVWENDDDSDYASSSSGDVAEFLGSSNVAVDGAGGRCATRKVVTSQCRTEEVEPGKFIRKCEKTEQVFKDCVGRPSKMVQSNQEYSEEDVTDQMVKGSFPFESAEHGPSYFPGLRNDIEAIERNFVDGIVRFFQAAEGMKDEFLRSVGAPHIYDDDAPSSHRKHGIQIEGHPPTEAFPKKNSDGYIDLSGMARDV
ncbi:UNVERIFIED_CONTAM: Fra a 1-associated protein [Sesamum radiatum]|uniref:Fra a 1-associated protein n=1 Tax=Sesamum radiatum TaxID=300843 RepID=A0AAW2KMY4_SESRA